MSQQHPRNGVKNFTGQDGTVKPTPIVDGKYYHPITNELKTAVGHEVYSGPPAVDMVISSLHAETGGCIMRAARPFAVEALLWEVTKVIHEYDLPIDSMMVTTYATRVVIAHELTVEEFYEISGKMTNGIWHQPESL